MNHRHEFSPSTELLGDAAELADAVVAEDLPEARFRAALIVMKARESGYLRIMAAATEVVVTLGMNDAAPLPRLGRALLHLADELGTLGERDVATHPDLAWVRFSARRSMAPVRPEAKPASSARVLIVEDDMALTDTMVQALALTGTTIVGCARDARSANDMLDREPTVVLVDYTLLDGPCDDFIDQCRDGGFSIAVLTAFRPNELPTKYRQLPILTKPYGIDALANLVERLG
jgi:CheY-like chemotaxis protein